MSEITFDAKTDRISYFTFLKAVTSVKRAYNLLNTNLDKTQRIMNCAR